MADGYPLGEWIKRQRRYYAKGILEDERVRKLQELPGGRGTRMPSNGRKA